MNGVSLGRKKAGEALIHDMPLTFLFRAVYQPGAVEAVSYTDGKEVSRTGLKTTGKPVSIRLTAETEMMKADGASLCYVNAELIDENGNVVPDVDALLKAEITGAAELIGFGSGNPITDGEEFYDLLVDWGYRGPVQFSALAFDIAAASGLLTEDQAERLKRSMAEATEEAFSHLDRPREAEQPAPFDEGTD